jgi:hypothetical protein
MPIYGDILDVIRAQAALLPDFDRRLGPGGLAGNGMTHRFINLMLNPAVAERWGDQVKINEPATRKCRLNFDFYVPSEATAIEVALSLRNIGTEYEKDIFKALLAKADGKPMERLILIGKFGSIKRHNLPASRAIREWVVNQSGIQIKIFELPGLPHVRRPRVLPA